MQHLQGPWAFSVIRVFGNILQIVLHKVVYKIFVCAVVQKETKKW